MLRVADSKNEKGELHTGKLKALCKPDSFYNLKLPDRSDTNVSQNVTVLAFEDDFL
jgi:hypothetical protein